MQRSYVVEHEYYPSIMTVLLQSYRMTLI